MGMYRAKSLDDIAAQFERMATKCSERAETAKGKERAFYEAQWATWIAAAIMLRETTIEP